MTGAYCHLFTRSRDFVPMLPSEDVAKGNFQNEVDEPGGVDLYPSISTLNRDTYITSVEPTSDVYRCKIPPPAGLDTDGSVWTFRSFYRIFRADSWSITFDVYDTSTVTLVFSETINGSGEVSDGDFNYTLTAPEIALISDPDSLELEITVSASHSSPVVNSLASIVTGKPE